MKLGLCRCSDSNLLIESSSWRLQCAVVIVELNICCLQEEHSSSCPMLQSLNTPNPFGRNEENNQNFIEWHRRCRVCVCVRKLKWTRARNAYMGRCMLLHRATFKKHRLFFFFTFLLLLFVAAAFAQPHIFFNLPFDIWMCVKFWMFYVLLSPRPASPLECFSIQVKFIKLNCAAS